MEKNSKETEKKIEKRFHLTIGEYLYEKMKLHFRHLKFFYGKKHQKNTWLNQAILEKLSKPFSSIPYNHHLSFPIDDDLAYLLEERVALIKKHQPYSARQFVLEAIQEQLEIEEELLKNKVKPHSNE